MDWVSIRALLKTLTGDLAGLPDNTEWEDQPRPYVSDSIRAILLLSTDPIIMVGGTDDIVTDYDAGRPLGEELQDTVRGVRNFTLKVKAESYEQTDGETAATYLERVRDRLSRRSSLEALRSVECALIRCETVQAFPEIRDDRWTSIAVLDIRMRASVSEADPNRYGYIETVEVTG